MVGVGGGAVGRAFRWGGCLDEGGRWGVAGRRGWGGSGVLEWGHVRLRVGGAWARRWGVGGRRKGAAVWVWLGLGHCGWSSGMACVGLRAGSRNLRVCCALPE